MWEVNKSASHGGISIRRIFIFTLVTIVASLLGLFTLPQSASAIVVTPDTVTQKQTTTGDTTNSNVNADGSAITVDDTTAAEAAKAKAKNNAGSCGIDGVGWLVCPITKALAGGMDWVYGVLCTMMAVQPVANNNDGALFKAWTYMRSFANVAFVIAFLIIIYSQMTNFGINNYGIKKLLPRLIIAAILVNVSYYICAVAVDISNILGYSIQQAFLSMREGLLGADAKSLTIPSWQSITALVLSGTGVGVGAWVAISTFEVAGAVTLLVPAILSCLLAVLVAFVILTARQAIITILIIIAPLAFVAYLLPNTEKLFEKWKSTLLTLLILFPAFSVVFGGSQLASIAIIKNAHSIQVLIMGLMVQIAPLMITPLLMKLSGNMLNKIGGFVNNPSKGLVDRANNLAKDFRDTKAAKTLSNEAGRTNLPLKARQKMDYGRRKREADRKTYGNIVGNRFERDYSEKIRANEDSLNNYLEDKITGDEATRSKMRLDKIHENSKGGIDPHTGKPIKPDPRAKIKHPIEALVQRSEAATKDIALNAIATQNAKRLQQKNLSDALLKNDEKIEDQSLREYAGGVDIDNGADTALSIAVVANRDASTKVVNDRSELIKQFNLSGDDRQNLALGKTKDGVKVKAVEGVYKTADGKEYPYTFDMKDTSMREAAIETQMKIGAYGDIEALIAQSGGDLKEWKTTISSSVAANGLTSKAIFFGGKLIDDISQGNIKNKGDLEDSVNEFIRDGKFKAEDLANNDEGAIKLIMAAVNKPPVRKKGDTDAKYAEKVQKLAASKKALNTVISDILSPDVNVGRNASQSTVTALDNLQKQLNNEKK